MSVSVLYECSRHHPVSVSVLCECIRLHTVSVSVLYECSRHHPVSVSVLCSVSVADFTLCLFQSCVSVADLPCVCFCPV